MLEAFYKQINWQKTKTWEKAVAADITENKGKVTTARRHSQMLKKIYLVVGGKVEEYICINQMMLFSKNKNTVIINLDKRIIKLKQVEKSGSTV